MSLGQPKKPNLYHVVSTNQPATIINVDLHAVRLDLINLWARTANLLKRPMMIGELCTNNKFFLVN
jgi:hypothetical protein